jgi:transmembrane sensor
MADQRARLQYLFKKFIEDTATPDEIREFWRCFAAVKKDDPVGEAFISEESQRLWHVSSWDNESEKDWTDALKRIHQQAFEDEKGRPLVFMRKPLISLMAAAVLLLCVGSYLLYFHQSPKRQIKTIGQQQYHKNDLPPGSNGAILTLADGKKIILDSTAKGVAAQGNEKITYKDGLVLYAAGTGARGEMAYNNMTTDKGHQYQLVLSDGSKVWLNAASSIRYPARFAEGERKVEITGEAYFEIAKNATSPFEVTVRGMEVQVLGTRFNIYAYDDEPTIKTTLIEGSVQVGNDRTQVKIRPGQQAQLDSEDKIAVINSPDAEGEMAWKDGRFNFEEADLKEIMKQVARWYDVEVEYKGDVTGHYFTADISRNKNLSDVLKALKTSSDIDFRIEGRKLIVIP